jgi:acyl carrier protein
MMNENDVLERLTDLFRDIFDEPSLTLTRDTTAADVPDWDSLNHITIIVESEKKFGVKFQTAEVEELKNVGSFVDLILKKRAKAGL